MIRLEYIRNKTHEANIVEAVRIATKFDEVVCFVLPNSIGCTDRIEITKDSTFEQIQKDAKELTQARSDFRNGY